MNEDRKRGILMKYIAGAFVLGIMCAAAKAASSAAASTDWKPVDQDVWAILMAEPQAHMLSAKEDLAADDRKDAAAEIRLAGNFLMIQEKRLDASSRQLDRLSKDVENGVAVSSAQVDETFGSAIAALDHQQSMIPVMAGAETIYEDEAAYHLTQAQSHLNQKQDKLAAGEIRKATAYLKLKALHAGMETKVELQSSASDLDRLADKLDAGTATEAKNFEAAFARANKAVRSAL
jgi:hypothetical protein